MTRTMTTSNPPRKPFTLEVCCESVADVFAAYEGGADRVELNSALSLGGLTPSAGSIKILREKLPTFPVAAMVRPRGGGFTYSDLEYALMKKDALSLMEAGADGIVFGFLKEDFSIDLERTKEFTRLIHGAGKEAIFHRAFDLVADYDAAICDLIKIGIDRVLTSGGAPTVMEGLDMLKRLQALYGSQIQLLAGSGVRPENANVILKKTGITQLHSSCKKQIPDPTAKGPGHHPVNFSLYENNPGILECVDMEIVKSFQHPCDYA